MTPLTEAEARQADFDRRQLLEDANMFSANVLSKGSALERKGGLHPVEEDPDGRTFHVTGSGGNTYTVQVVEFFDEDFTVGELDHARMLPWITCTCPNGMNKSHPTCYHSAALMLKIMREQDEQEEDPTDWADREQEERDTIYDFVDEKVS
jgi:uncharacterized Zn finger protein